jgi:hypothetical protein
MYQTFLSTRPGRRSAWLISAALLVGLAASAQAQEGRSLSVHEQGSLTDQLEADITPIPAGQGALLVPSLTDPSLESAVQVYFGKERVAWGRTGQRILLPPGTYTVIVGHGDQQRRPSAEVIVREGATTPVPAFFAAVRVTAVDLDGKPVQVNYSLRDLERNTDLVSKQTSDDYDYQSTRTWLVAARPLEIDLQGDRGAVQLLPVAGQILRYRLVVAQDRLVRAELAERELVKEQRTWRLRWVIGGDASLTSQSGRLGSVDGDFLRAGLFMDAEVGIDRGNHLALLRLGVEESWISLNTPEEELELQKFTDEVQAELLYNYRLGRIAGPYVRGVARTALRPTTYQANGETTVVERDRDDDVVDRSTLGAGQELELLGGFQPLDLRLGAGLSLTAFDNQVANLSFYGGVAARRATYDDGLLVLDYRDNGLDVITLQDDRSFGLEAGVNLGVRLGQSVAFSMRGESYMPESQLFDDEEVRPVFRLDNSLTFSVNSFLSMVYDFDIRQDAYEYDEPRLSHNLSLRLQHTLF